jgi:hypothetical protein
MGSNKLSVLTSGSERFFGLDHRRVRIVRRMERSDTKKVIESKRSTAGIVGSIPSNPVMGKLTKMVMKRVISAIRSQRISKES